MTELPAPSTERADPRMRFYVLRVASNKEDRVREGLMRKVRIEGMEGKVGRILVPTERIRQVKAGVKKLTDQKLYAGYVFIEVIPDDHGKIPEDVWFLVKETEGVGDFIQASGKPHAMDAKDEAKMLEKAFAPEEQPALPTDYQKGDRIKVVDGPFVNFEGEVEEIMPDKGQVKIMTTIFGRSTPLDLEYWQIEKL